MVLERLLAEWIPSRADSLLTQLMTGLGTLPNARMTYRLMALGALARSEAPVRAFFAEELDGERIRQYRTRLAGTRFLAGLGAFLRDFGHRGPLESDVASPRFADDPGLVLRLIRLYAQADTLEDPKRHAASRAVIRRGAQQQVRQALRQGRRWTSFVLCWTGFSTVCAALQKLIALRDENRHVMTLMVTHLRRAAREVGRRAARAGLLASADDVFLLRFEELPRILVEPRRDWRRLVAERAREREHDATLPAPDVRRGGTAVDTGTDGAPHGPDRLVGLGASPGHVTGTIRILRSASEARALSGEIVVLPALEPTLTLLFPLVKGVVAEMGGILSHAAILAREYGLPAVVNVPDATQRLRDGDLVELDGGTGTIRRLDPASGERQDAWPTPDDQGRDDEPQERPGEDIGNVVPAQVDAAQRDGRRQHEERQS
jgi:pyruvate,water dikinase